MDYQAVTTLIGSFGFPIAMCFLIAWYINNTHKELTKAINNINITTQALLVKLGMEDEE